MTLLAPALLALGLAAVVPLLLHLLQRQQGPRVVFPALRYLRRAEREHATRIRLRQILLLAIRLLALVLLAGAAARPFVPGGGHSHPPTSVALILDNSLSTAAVSGDLRVIDALKEAALRTLSAAGPDDRFWLIRAGSPWEPAISGHATRVAAAVRATEPASAGADLAAELRRAASILAAEPEGRAREIQLLSDMQETSFGVVAAPALSAPPIRAFAADVALRSNRAVTAIEVGGGLPPRSGEGSTVSARIAEWGPDGRPVDRDTFPGEEESEPVSVRLVVDGAVRGAAAARGGSSVVLPFPPVASGLLTGYVEVDPDGLRGDDRRYFAVEVVPPVDVALAGPAGDSPFLDQALDVLEDAGRIRRVAGSQATVVVSPGARSADAARLGASVVLLPPSSPVELGAANGRLAAAGIPWRFGPPRRGEGRLGAPDSGLAAALVDVRLSEVYELVPADPVDPTVRLRLRNGEPWAVSGALRGGGRYLILATALTPEASSIPTSAAMVPLLDLAISEWATAAPSPRDRRPGDLVTVRGDRVETPAGAEAVRPASVFRLTDAGIYRVLDGDALVAAYAVNPPASESVPTRLTHDQVEARLPGRDARIGGADAWPELIFHQRLGREITSGLIIVALALLVLESVLAASGRPAAATPSTARAGRSLT